MPVTRCMLFEILLQVAPSNDLAEGCDGDPLSFLGERFIVQLEMRKGERPMTRARPEGVAGRGVYGRLGRLQDFAVHEDGDPPVQVQGLVEFRHCQKREVVPEEHPPYFVGF